MPQSGSRPSFRVPSSLSHASRSRLLALAPLALALSALPVRAGEPAAVTAPAPSVDLVLPPLVVTANQTDTPVTQVGSAVTVITGEELQQQQIRMVSDVLREVPGVAVSSSGPTGSLTQVRIRGSEGNQTLVMIDGIIVNNPAASDEFDFGNLLAQEVERIEVLRGPQSALYGSDAVGGVINIVTRKGDGKPKMTLRAEGGSLNSADGLATISGGTDTHNYLFSATGLYTGNVSVAANGAEKDPFSAGTLLAKGGFKPTEETEISAVGRYTRSLFHGDGFVGGIGAVDDKSSTLTNQAFGRVQAAANLLDNTWQHILGFSATTQDQEYRDSGTKTSTYTGNTAVIDYKTNYLLSTDALVKANHTFTLGGDFTYNGVQSWSAWSDLDKSNNEGSLVGQYQVTLLDALTLTGAVRQDFNEMFEDSTTGRFTGAYFFDRTGTKVRGSYGTGVKNPTMFELYGYTNGYQGNPDLKPEEAYGWDVGIDQQIWGNRVLGDVTYFNQRITDLITGSGQTSINMPGTSSIYGVEVGLTVVPLDNLSIRGAYTYTHGEDSTGAELIRRAPNIASVSVNYGFLDNKANVNLSVQYTGEQKDWAYDAMWNKSVVNLDPYTLVNLAASYQVTEKAQIYGRVENLLDEDYQQVYTYASPGIAAYGGVKVTF